MTLFHFPLPDDISRRAALIIEIARKWQDEAFIETALIEKVGFFKGGEFASEDWGAREQDRGFDLVGNLSQASWLRQGNTIFSEGGLYCRWSFRCGDKALLAKV